MQQKEDALGITYPPPSSWFVYL